VSASTAAAQQQQPQTSQGLPLVIIPGITGNILAVVSFLIGTSSFILGLRMQSAARTTTTGTTPSSSIMYKYFELLILALVVPSILINTYGILLVGSHLYLQDAPYLLLLFALFIPAVAILFLVRKLRVL
jgi:predicted secreted protein